jgi:hypothetical protein
VLSAGDLIPLVVSGFPILLRNEYSRVRSIYFEVNSRLARIDSKALSLLSLQSILIPPSVEILGSDFFAS